jgi:predicted  nucleic acid-binding Zn-ribbon protein
MTTDIDFRCTWCGTELAGPETLRGKVVKCGECNKEVRVPEGPRGGQAQVERPAWSKQELDAEKMANKNLQALSPRAAMDVPRQTLHELTLIRQILKEFRTVVLAGIIISMIFAIIRLVATEMAKLH